MRIINLSKLITTKEIKNAIKILHKNYKDKNITIHVYGDGILSKILMRINGNEQWEYPDDGYRRVGVYKPIEKRIEIYPLSHSWRENYSLKECIINTIYHELRHNYQYKFKTSKYFDSIQLYSFCVQDYYSNWTEKDANRFAYRMLNKYRGDIKK